MPLGFPVAHAIAEIGLLDDLIISVVSPKKVEMVAMIEIGFARIQRWCFDFYPLQ